MLRRAAGLAVLLSPVLAWQHDAVATVSWGPRRLAETGELQVTIGLPEKKTWRLRLRRNHGLVASGAHVLHGERKTELGPGPTQNCFYLGHLESPPQLWDDVTASITTCGGQLSGMLIHGNQSFLLDPIEPDQDKYWLRNLNQTSLQMQRDVLRFVTLREPGVTRRLTTGSTKYIEVLVVNDFERYTAFGGQAGLAQLATHTVAVLNAVTAIYRAAPSQGAVFPYTVQVVLVAQHTFVVSDPWTPKMVGSEVAEDSLLEAFLTWSAAEMAAGRLPENDNRLLLSGRDFVASTVGYAPLSSMCDVSRSGSINMCGASSGAVADCAAVVAHEMGHNFGMTHDSGSCPQSGFVMAAVSSQPAEQFSSCSVADISQFFQEVYEKNGQCLDNKPSRVFGDPVCGNGFREEGEDCDCGASDCATIDPCCDGTTCKFSHPSYQCSDAVSSCCAQCLNVTAAAQRVCRTARSACDRPEVCPGGTADCPRDEYFYPGDSCTVAHNGKSYAGLCAMGSCHSMEYTCAVDVTRDFSGNWDLTEPCASFNDDCQTVVCHDASTTSATQCGQQFSVHGIHMPVPDGTPCWHLSEPNGQRTGMCFQGLCRRPESLAVVALCGNGGIDYGEECDCGKTPDPCCNCSSCTLLNSSACSAADACCESCQLKPAGAVCRAASSTCDKAEVCSGSSALCPPDLGEVWGTACAAADGTPSTCYGKVCLPSLDEQCEDKTSGEKPVAQRNLSTGFAREYDQHGCTGPWCCSSCTQMSGPYSVNGVRVTDPVLCSQCSWSETSSTFTVNGVSRKIYLGAAVDGTKLADASKICLRAEAIIPDSACNSNSEFLELSVGRCLPCDDACSGCYGPSPLDCACCRLGPRDARGRCPSAVGLGTETEAVQACTIRTTQVTTSDPSTAVLNRATSAGYDRKVMATLLLCAAGSSWGIQ